MQNCTFDIAAALAWSLDFTFFLFGAKLPICSWQSNFP